MSTLGAVTPPMTNLDIRIAQMNSAIIRCLSSSRSTVVMLFSPGSSLRSTRCIVIRWIKSGPVG